ncbi:MAG: type IV pilus assembly protein PilM [Candidatus Hydrogenedens sp.]|nr:type IV pilus assembly protein PilM [Candidatus Hydrogenedens sp.]
MGFRKPRKVIGVDIGTHAVKTVLMSRAGGRLKVEQAAMCPIDRNLMNLDPVKAQEEAVRTTLEKMPVSQCLIVGALTGQTVVVRYPRLTDVPKERLESEVAKEAANSIPYDLKDVFLDWVVLEEYSEEGRQLTKVLLVAARKEVVDVRLQVMRAAGLECGILGVDSLALADAAEACDFFMMNETVALINIGLSSSSIQFVKNGVSNFIRDVNWGARELIQSVAKGMRCNYEQALERLEGYSLDHTAVPEALEAGGIESSAFAHMDSTGGFSQVESGGYGHFETPYLEDIPQAGSYLDPLDDEQGLLESDLSYLDSSLGKGASVFDLVVTPLNRLGVELRRSFDYYEHQLYEQPVDRILISGGPVAFAPLVESLQEVLNFSDIEIVNPAASALLVSEESSLSAFHSHPAQFAVAVGLAARGMVEI